MITYPRKPISLSLNSSDLLLHTQVDTAATLYQKSPDCFHLLLTEPPLPEAASDSTHAISTVAQPRLLWLEISPYRLIMTMQSNGNFSYRHWLERGIYGMSRYWLQDEALGQGGQIRLRNFTRNLQIDGDPLPTHLSVEYELWANRVPMGRYELNLQIHHG
ncbi:MAG: hypothetical protein HC857_15785 [Synechococcales cyanobacterium RU_4_20]|nr:hypothetical protein [Synechococcales cyanobacterium RU_4_20]NJR67316.1 hypothetical protein [Synechococcales cyanobacterium CRU_2_2]